MTTSAVLLQYRMPVGIHRETGCMVTLREAARDRSRLVGPGELDVETLMDVLVARWEAGEWEDASYGTDVLDLERAVRELRSQSEIGRELLNLGARAVEMALEDAWGGMRA